MSGPYHVVPPFFGVAHRVLGFLKDADAIKPPPPTPGDEEARLLKRLFEDPEWELLGFSVTRGSGPCTREELCAEINRALDQVQDREAQGFKFSNGDRTEKRDIGDLVAGISSRRMDQ